MVQQRSKKKGRTQSRKTKSTKRRSSSSKQKAKPGAGRAKASGLTARQTAFVRDYLVDGNATQAAIRAGYSKRSAAYQGHYLSQRNPKTVAAIAKAQAARSQRVEITADRVLLELARVGLSDVRRLFTWDADSAAVIPSQNLTDAEAAAIASVKSTTTTVLDKRGRPVERRVTMELRLWDKNAALREMGKHLGVSENVTVTLRDRLEGMTEEELVADIQGLLREVQGEYRH